jgi:transposase-like protein|nr:MAG TPA: 60S ribosomal subunit [Bacteriophage sp.]
MSKEKKPILNLQKGCPFCGNTDLVSGCSYILNRAEIICRACHSIFSYKIEEPNSRADETKTTVKSTESIAEAILSELKDIKSYVAELAGYTIED